jgi:3-hydroxyacyl-CoA dehydrogenase
MARRYRLAIAVLAALSVLVAGAAVAATRALSPERESQAVINDAANQLGVQPDELSDALKQALKNRVDKAVEDGRLTEDQGRKMKERIDVGGVPLFGLGPGLKEHHEFHPFHAKLEAAADYLDMTEAQLREALSDGKTLAQVARDREKSVEGLVDALLAYAENKLENAVEAGRLTEAQKREMLAGLRQRIKDIVNGRIPQIHRGPGFPRIEPDAFVPPRDSFIPPRDSF